MSQRVSVDVFNTVTLNLGEGKDITVDVKIDTGAVGTSLDQQLAEEIGLYTPENVIGKREFQSALGVQSRELFPISFELAGVNIDTVTSSIDRSNLKFDMIVGRQDLEPYSIEYDTANEVSQLTELPHHHNPEKQRQVIDVFNTIEILLDDGRIIPLDVKVDTGALRTSIDEQFAREIGLYHPKKVIGTKKVKSALGLQTRELIPITFRMAGVTHITTASLADRSNLMYKMIIGRIDLQPFRIEYNQANDPQNLHNSLK